MANFGCLYVFRTSTSNSSDPLINKYWEFGHRSMHLWAAIMTKLSISLNKVGRFSQLGVKYHLYSSRCDNYSWIFCIVILEVSIILSEIEFVSGFWPTTSLFQGILLIISQNLRELLQIWRQISLNICAELAIHKVTQINRWRKRTCRFLYLE